jgi:hypothetical protein
MIEVAAPPTGRPDVTVYEDSLIALLARLEFIREAMTESRPTKAIGLANDLIAEVIAFADRWPGASDRASHLGADEKVGEFFAAIGTLRGPGNGTKLIGNVTSSPAYRQCFSSIFEAVKIYFEVYTDRYPNSRMARPWVEAAASFVVDLKRTIPEEEMTDTVEE